MKKRYSHFIRPLQILVDILIINFIIYLIYDKEYLNIYFQSYVSIFWIVTTYYLGFYKVYRHTSVLRLFTLLSKQFSIFFLGYFAYFGVFREGEIVNNQFIILISIFGAVFVIKFIWFFLLHKYRSLGNNYRNTVVFGFDQPSKNIIKLFKSKSNLGYRFLGFFSNKEYKHQDYIGNFNDFFEFCCTNEVDEIYCSLTYLTKNEIRKINKFATEKDIVLKLIPDTNELYRKNQSAEFYDDTLLVLNVNKLPFDFSENYFQKRVFDIFFSIIVCLVVLSWLTPLLWILVKIESKGPLIFKQKREGLNGKEFVCYKFRSMRINKFSDKVHAKKYDVRVTKIGAFLRKTSMDELPQFFNVLLGDMSIVGPRPHLESLSLEYQKDVEDYLKRHIVKPGITGLAQVSGYRGEIKRKSDIKNRVRLDIFYIENWSFLLDIKIIIQTVLNVFKGEEKAY